MLAVTLSYPEPAEAKETPVRSSSNPRFGWKYAGTVSLIPTYAAVIFPRTSKKITNLYKYFRSNVEELNCTRKIKLTYEIGDEAAVAKPPRRNSAGEIYPVRVEIALQSSGDVVVVAGIHCGIAENENRRNCIIERPVQFSGSGRQNHRRKIKSGEQETATHFCAGRHCW